MLACLCYHKALKLPSLPMICWRYGNVPGVQFIMGLVATADMTCFSHRPATVADDTRP